MIINGGKARDYGVDADLTVKLTNDLRLTSGLNWISPKFTSFPTCLISSRQGGVPSIIGSCAGNQLPLAAKFTGNIGVSYNRNLGFATLDGAINLYHSSGYFTESDNITEQRSFDLLNGSVKLTLPSKISIGIYGKNLFDRRIKNFGSTVPNGTHFALWQAPRTYGVTLGYSF
ncbi:MAG: TonB-dependent receptor [Oxalobacteraceae bacterium]|nr:MAG: TonB-dependent receptor [Oxalobacteraceae bacterium]